MSLVSHLVSGVISTDFLITTYLFPNSNLGFIEFKAHFLSLQTTRLMLVNP